MKLPNKTKSRKIMKRNTPQLWDQVWESPTTTEEDIFKLVKEENCIRWQRIERIVLKEFGSFNNLKVIEIGAGVGTNAALAAKRGAKVTILDYSETALKRAREFFERNGLSAEFVKQDALSLPADLLGKYDISMSFGLTEHFEGTERININKAHFDILRKGGLAFISVPNKYNLPYRVFKFVAERTGRWNVGEEYPYSRKELRNICQQIGITEYSFLGDSLFWSFNFINPFNVIRKMGKLKNNLNISRIRKEKGTFLDQYLSYALVLYGKK
jgi:2-polyprenyl-3-methyl-5-hydroxy-6-metoxy-1,4-benzoquinol methylase